MGVGGKLGKKGGNTEGTKRNKRGDNDGEHEGIARGKRGKERRNQWENEGRHGKE